MIRKATILAVVLVCSASAGWAQDQIGTEFTYQGQLKQLGMPVTGTADFIFTLWDAPVGGNQVGQTVQTIGGHPVVDGLFTIQLDFNPVGYWIYDGTALWLEVQVDYPAGGGAWETLAPRQLLTATPYTSFATVASAAPWAGILDMPAGFADGVDDIGDGFFWSLTGNAGTTPGANFLGTTDDTPLELKVDGWRVLRLEPNAGYPNVIAGKYNNATTGETVSATIAGGREHVVQGWQPTIGGGVANQALSNNTTIAGGDHNVIGDIAHWSSIGGGQQNEATQEFGTIPGGQQNLAGGEYCFAAGRRAKVRRPEDVGGGDTNGDEGTFVWADSGDNEFWSTGPNQFLIRASGGVGINTNDPDATLHVVSTYAGEKIQVAGPYGGKGLTIEQPYPTDTAYPVFGADIQVNGGTVYGVYAHAKQLQSGYTGTATYGVYGKCTNTSQDFTISRGYGGYFVAEGTVTGAGVYGSGYSTGVHGTTTSTGGSGVYGTVAGATGKGVHGAATDTGFGPSYGGYFTSAGADGIGVYGKATGATGRAVVGEATASFGVGVYGAGDTGVKADATLDGGYALWADVSADHGTALYARCGENGGHAGHFVGNVKICDRTTGNTVIELGTGLDYAEGFDVTEATTVTAGMVLVIDPAHPGQLAVSTTAYDRRVAGIVAGANGLGSAVKLGCGQFDHDVALAGRVYCYAVAGDQAIEPGDLLTTSDVPGHAMKVHDHARSQGAILGKAMQGLAAGERGQILVLVTLQ